MKKTNVIAVLLLAAIAIRLLPALDHKHFWPLGDDSYYALSVARNIAEGNGITYSGSLTNGVQPLYVFISIPFYYIFGQNDLLTITCILLMLAMINAGTGLLIYGLLRRVAGESGALLGFVIWSFSPYVIEHGVNGLETPLTTFFFCGFSLVLYRKSQSSSISQGRGFDHSRQSTRAWRAIKSVYGTMGRRDCHRHDNIF